jgi:hypothetical protein
MRAGDVALTVGGILATMALAYLLYRQQQKSAGGGAAVQDVTDPNYYTDQGLYDSSMTYQYASQLSSLSVPTVSSTSSTSSVASQVDTSSSTAATGNPPDSDVYNLLANILAEYHTSNAGDYGEADLSSLTIPVLNVQPIETTTGIPTTAADALTSAQNMLPTSASDDPSSHPVIASPIVADPYQAIVTTGGAAGNYSYTPTPAVPPPSIQAVATTTAPMNAIHNNHLMAQTIGSVNEIGY